MFKKKHKLYKEILKIEKNKEILTHKSATRLDRVVIPKLATLKLQTRSTFACVHQDSPYNLQRTQILCQKDAR